MNYHVLKIEIESGPLAAECAGKSDDEIADILNEPRFMAVKSRFITARTMLAELPGAGVILDKLESVASSVPEVKWSMKYLTGETGIDVGHPGTIAQIDALSAGGVLTMAEAESLKNMALQPASRAELAGLGVVSYNDVNKARAL